jgi:hypothetical protein
VEKDATQWQTYRTRFLVRARRLSEPMAFVDAFGREQHGKAGDYLVETAIGLRRIMPRKFFEDVYVAIQPPVSSETSSRTQPGNSTSHKTPQPKATAISTVENDRRRHAPQPLIA